MQNLRNIITLTVGILASLHLVTALSLRLPAFDAISASGNLRITLKGGTQRIKIPAGDKVKVYVKNQTLYIVGNEASKHEAIQIVAPDITSLQASKHAEILAKDLHSHSLQVIVNGNSDLTLRGMVPLARIAQSGSSHIDIRWVNSQNLMIHAQDASKIRLAGFANVVHVRLHDAASLDAQYLRVNKMYIQTKGHSIAKVLVLDKLSADAYGRSNVYYMKKPRYFTEFTHESGNVLQMAALP